MKTITNIIIGLTAIILFCYGMNDFVNGIYWGIKWNLIGNGLWNIFLSFIIFYVYGKNSFDYI